MAMMSAAELSRLTMDDFDGDEAGAFALGALAGMLASAGVIERAASTASGLDDKVLAEVLRGLSKTFRDTVDEKLCEIQKAKLAS